MAIAQKSIQRVGNSSGVIIPPELLHAAGLNRGDAVTLRVERGTIVIAPVQPLRSEVIEAGERFIALHAQALQKLAE